MEYALTFSEAAVLAESVSTTSFTPVRWPLSVSDVLSLVESVACTSVTPVRHLLNFLDSSLRTTEYLGGNRGQSSALASPISVIKPTPLQSFLILPLQRLWSLVTDLFTTRTYTIQPVVRSWSITDMSLLYADPKQSPASVEDFLFDFTAVIGADTITSATWTTPPGITQVSTTNTSTTATVRLGGGSVGLSYTCTCAATLVSGRVMTQSIVVPVARS